MRYAEIQGTPRHPHVVVITLDPVQYHDLERRFQERDEVRVLHCDSSEPDLWTVHLGCASQAVADRVEENWG